MRSKEEGKKKAVHGSDSECEWTVDVEEKMNSVMEIDEELMQEERIQTNTLFRSSEKLS